MRGSKKGVWKNRYTNMLKENKSKLKEFQREYTKNKLKFLVCLT